MSRQTGAARDLDPFDLPEWLGAEPVVWTPEGGIHDRHLVTGALSAGDGRSLPCALLAVDEAYPEPVAEIEVSERDVLHGAAFAAAELPEPEEGAAPPGAYTCC